MRYSYLVYVDFTTSRPCAIAVDGVRLQFAQAAQLQDGIARVDAHGEQSHGEAGQQAKRGGGSGVQGLAAGLSAAGRADLNSMFLLLSRQRGRL